MRSIIVCVNYADLLAVTLPYNRHHFTEIMVVTSTTDKRTQEVIRDNEVHGFETDAFYDDGAIFNKWKALEAGLDRFGRRDWICVMDADVLWPKKIYGWEPTEIGKLYGPLRHMFEDLSKPFATEDRWCEYPIHRNVSEWAGYTQIFHADDKHLGATPWHQTNWRHAGGADSFFQLKWPAEDKVRTPWNVLHLGPAGENWCGRSTKMLDGTVPVDAKQHQAQMQSIWAGRRGKRGDDRFTAEKL